MKNPVMQNFERCALISGLVTLTKWDDLWLDYLDSRKLPRNLEGEVYPDKFASFLVERKIINGWQSQQLLAGHTKFNLGSYEIINSLGQGGMGQVFLAQHSITRQEAAVKVLPRDKSTPEAIRNFQHEIQVLSALHHPNIAGALDAGEDGNVYFLVCEYVPGQNLRKLIRNGRPLTMKSAASVLSQAALGLHHVHEMGFVHRDIKPGNILVTPQGVTKITDFGLASAIGGKNDPKAGKIVGTADYLSPDQVRSPANPVPIWDVYSLGCTLYYVVTGKVPFPGGSTLEKARAHLDLLPLDPRLLNPTLSSEFVNVIADMMAKEPDKRIPNAFAVIERLSKWSPPLPCDIQMVDGAEIQAAKLDKAPIGINPVSAGTIMNAGAIGAAIIINKPKNNRPAEFASKNQAGKPSATPTDDSFHPAFSESEDLVSVQLSKQIEEGYTRRTGSKFAIPTLGLFVLLPTIVMGITWLAWKLLS